MSERITTERGPRVQTVDVERLCEARTKACPRYNGGVCGWCPTCCNHHDATEALRLMATDLAADLIDARASLAAERTRREAAEATVERSRAHLRRSMDAMMEAPGMFGDDAAVEVLMLVSLGALRVIERPHAPPRFVMDAFIAFAHRKFPRMGALGLSGYLRRIGRSAELPALMAEFRAEVEASWAVSR